jgi:uncharacterized membrane protein
VKYLHPANIRLHGRKSDLDQAIDKAVAFIGTLKFLTWQTVIVAFWLAGNLVGVVRHWDPYPFIMLNLLFSTQAAYAAPLIMMSQNRQTEHDREVAEEAYRSIADIRTQLVELRTILVGGYGQEQGVSEVVDQHPVTPAPS